MNPGMILIRFSEAAGSVAGQHQMPDFGFERKYDGQCPNALRTVSRSRQRNHHCWPSNRKRFTSVRQQDPSANCLGSDSQLILQNLAYTVAGILRTARSRENQTRKSVQRLFQRGSAGQHQRAGLRPGGRLLTDLSQRVEISQPVLLVGSPCQ